MKSTQATNAYRQSEIQTKIHPVKLIHLMYERTLLHLQKASAGIKEKNPQKRGENLGRAIAIISELNVSVQEDDTSEAARFLRGLYDAILVELPKVAISEDIQILHQAEVYVERLKEIWEQTAMKEMERERQGKDEEKSNSLNDISKKMERAHLQKKVGGVSVSI